MSIELTRSQVEQLLAMFGGDEDPDVTLTVASGAEGHSGPGTYAWWTDVPDEGATFLPEQEPLEQLVLRLDDEGCTESEIAAELAARGRAEEADTAGISIAALLACGVGGTDGL